MAFTRTKRNNESSFEMCFRLGWLFALTTIVFCAGCGCDSDGTEALIEIVKPVDAELTYEDDADPDQSGFQYSVVASTENLELETAIELFIDDDRFDPPVISYPDEEEMLQFAVTLPEGTHELKAGSPTGSVFSDPVEYTLYNLVIDSPEDGDTLSSDSDSSEEGLQSDVVVNVYGFDADHEVVLTVTDENGGSETYEEQTDDAAEGEPVSVTFESVTFPTGEVELIATAELEGDETATSAAVTVTVPDSSCPAGYHSENGDCVLDEECLPGSCSRHGSCDDSSGTVICSCYDGYTGTYCDACDNGYHESGADCVEDEECPRTNVCSGNGTCNDSTGEPICTCDEGYTGDTCNRCAAGFHLDDGQCVLDQQCLATSCSGHGECSLNDDKEVVCDCDTGYADTYCDECDDGYHESGEDCVEDEDCPESGACSGHGSCDDSTGVAICTCDDGYEGSDCDDCEGGYHDDGDDCVLDQTCLPTSCSYHGTCDDSSGSVVCTCTGGFTASSYCASCSTGFHPSGNQCVLDETCGANTCNQHGSCDVVDYETVCDCDEGWMGDTCSGCAAGFHLDDGECVPDESCLPSSCAGHGTCDDSGDVVVCACEAGYTSESYCLDCDTGYHKNNGECVPDESCAVDSCNEHGDCEDETGEIVCDCDTGWDGATCTYCAPGYHFEQGGTVCVVDEECYPQSCAYHGTCNDDPGYVVCDCDTGYDPGAFCADCAVGYHDDDPAPEIVDCVVNEVCVADSCNNHGTCVDTTGIIVCTCDVGYTGDYCDGCNTGTGYFSCDTECCSSIQVCYEDACCTPDTCDDLAPEDFVECGDSGVTDNCGGTIDCGNCGANGSCVSNTCDCDDNYGVLTDEHECVHACDGYLPAVGCCYDNWLVSCSGTDLEIYNCSIQPPPYSICGWYNTTNSFNCYSQDTTPPEQSIDCPSNIVVDTPPACEDDEYEENDTWNVDATPVVDGSDIYATKCDGDADYYSIDLTSGQTITITLTFNPDIADLVLILWYSSVDYSTWHYIDYIMSGTGTASYSFTAGDEYPFYTGDYTGTGTYYIDIAEWMGDIAGYELTVSVANP